MNQQLILANSSKKNAIGYLAAFGINAIATLVASPLLASGLGNVGFGIFKTIQKMVDFAGAADGRPTQALKSVIARLQGGGSNLERQQAVGSALRTWLKFAPLLVICMIALIWIAPEMMPDVEVSERAAIRIAAAIFSANMILAPLLTIPDAVLMGVHKGYKSLLVQSIWVVVLNASMVVMAIYGFGLIGVAVASLVVLLLSGWSVLLVARAEVPWFATKKPNIESDRAFFRFSFSLLGWGLAEKALLATELLLISFLIGPATVTKYVFSSYAFQTALALCLFAGAAIMPGVGVLVGRVDLKSARQAVVRIRELVRFQATCLGSLAILFNETFVHIWAGNKNYIGLWPNLWLAALFLQLAFLRVEAQVQDLRLDIGQRLRYSAAGIGLSCALATLFYRTSNGSIAWLLAGIWVGRTVMSLHFSRSVNAWLDIKDERLFNATKVAVITMISFLTLAGVESVNSLTAGLIKSVVSIAILAIAYFSLLSPNARTLLRRHLLNRFDTANQLV